MLFISASQDKDKGGLPPRSDGKKTIPKEKMNPDTRQGTNPNQGQGQQDPRIDEYEKEFNFNNGMKDLNKKGSGGKK